MSSDTSTLVANATLTFGVGTQTRVAVLPLHGGHHAMWASPYYQADICNMTDDWVVMDQRTGVLYRFPIVADLVPWSRALVAAMDQADYESGNQWSDCNAAVRTATLASAISHQGDRLFLNIFTPGFVTPALVTGDEMTPVDRILAKMIADHPEAIVGE